jgi:transmembrane sensor
MNQSELILAEAIDWRIRLRDGGPETWDSFVLWLEEGPERSEAYDQAALADLDFEGAAIPLPAPANDGAASGGFAPRRGRWLVAIPGAAAALVAGLIVTQQMGGGASLAIAATAPGEHRQVALGAESSAELNGATRLVLDRNNPRSAELASGEALFRIRHDPDHPFQVAAGGHVIRDLGTEFDISRDRGRLSIGVVSGAVILDPDGAAVTIRAGQRAIVQGRATPTVAVADPAAIAGWRSGELSYSEAPLALVVEQLSRTAGIGIDLDPSLAALSFTGSIHVQPDRGATVGALAAALGVEARRDGQGWSIVPRGHKSR